MRKKQTTYKLLAMLLAVCMLLGHSVMPVNALATLADNPAPFSTGAPIISPVTPAPLTAEPGDTVTVPFHLTQNPGMGFMSVDVVWNPNLLTNVSISVAGSVLPLASVSPIIRDLPGGLISQRTDSIEFGANHYNTGLAFTVTATVASSLPANTTEVPIMLSMFEVADTNNVWITGYTVNDAIIAIGGTEPPPPPTGPVIAPVPATPVTAEPGDTVTIPFHITENPGYSQIGLDVIWDPTLLTITQSDISLTGSVLPTPRGVTPTPVPVPGTPYYRLRINAMLMASANNTANGLAFTVTAAVANSLPTGTTEIPIMLSMFEMAEHDGTPVTTYQLTNGIIEIDSTEPPPPPTGPIIAPVSATPVTAEPGDTVTIPFHITENPGYSQIGLDVIWDPTLLTITQSDISLTGSVLPTPRGVTPTPVPVPGTPYYRLRINAMLMASANNTANGLAFTVTAAVANSLPTGTTEIPIMLSMFEMAEHDGTPVTTYQLTNGMIEIDSTPPPPFVNRIAVSNNISVAQEDSVFAASATCIYYQQLVTFDIIIRVPNCNPSTITNAYLFMGRPFLNEPEMLTNPQVVWAVDQNFDDMDLEADFHDVVDEVYIPLGDLEPGTYIIIMLTMDVMNVANGLDRSGEVSDLIRFFSVVHD